MVGNVVTPFGPVLGEVVAESATPTSPGLSLPPGFFDVLLCRAFVVCETVSAPVPLDVMVDKILVKEILGLTKIALKLFWALLICLLMALPIRLFSKRLLANSAEVLLHSFCAPSSWPARHASLVVVLFGS
jgi:hypothetical protein